MRATPTLCNFAPPPICWRELLVQLERSTLIGPIDDTLPGVSCSSLDGPGRVELVGPAVDIPPQRVPCRRVGGGYGPLQRRIERDEPLGGGRCVQRYEWQVEHDLSPSRKNDRYWSHSHH